MQDEFGDRMKAYEAQYTNDRVVEPFIYARLDGRGFSKFTKDMVKPFDWRMTGAMQVVTQYLVEKTQALIGYTQSDEISLAWRGNEIMFDCKIQKLTSVLAGMASARFMKEMMERQRNTSFTFNPPVERIPHFDCRVFGLPSEEELANAFLWRVKDCRRNAISMIAQSKYSHKSLQGMSTREMIERLDRDGVEVWKYPADLISGSMYKRKLVERKLTSWELIQIPEKHRPDPNQLVIRHEIQLQIHNATYPSIKEAIFGKCMDLLADQPDMKEISLGEQVP